MSDEQFKKIIILLAEISEKLDAKLGRTSTVEKHPTIEYHYRPCVK